MTPLEGLDMTGIGDSHLDSVLVEELRHGSSAALASLFDCYADRIYNYCFRRTADWDIAEDATSTVFLEAWRTRDRVQVHHDSALPWLYGIATNVCRNLTRKQRRHLLAVSRLPRQQDAPDHAEDVVSRLDDERRMARLLSEIQALPKRDQDVLALVVWAGLSYEEAAAALDVPVGTVRSRLARARQRLSAATSRSENRHA
jgi:RNA polymerase sigma factor (sigma-70 family)